jgi:NADPH2:quinone reductase
VRAVRVLQFGEPEDLAIVEIPVPAPGPGEVLIEVHACGVNFPDLLVVRGEYQILAPLPFSPGKEIAGVVRAVGEGVTSVAPGQRVAAQLENGGYVEQVVVSAATVYPLPEAMDFVTGAALGLTYLTAHFALVEHGRFQAGEWVLVTGASGGVGSAAVQLAKALGGRVIAGVGTPSKEAFVRAQGADAVVGLSRSGLRDALREEVRTLTGGHGADVVVENIGGEVFEACLRALAWSGRIVVVGFVGGAFPTIRGNYLLIKNISASGLHWSDYRERDPAWVCRVQEALYELWRGGRLQPAVAAVYSLEQAPVALRRMASRGIQGKLVLAGRGRCRTFLDRDGLTGVPGFGES